MRLHAAPQDVLQSLGSVQVLLPADLAGLHAPGLQTQSQCYVSQLTLSKNGPFPWGRGPDQVLQPSDGQLVTCCSVPSGAAVSVPLRRKSQQN